MKLRRLSLSAALCLSILTMARPGLAQVQELEPEPPLVRQMLQEGWIKVADGVLQRGGREGQVETFTYNQEGLRWTVQRLEERVRSLEDEYSNYPSEELARVVEGLREEISEANDSLSVAQAETLGGGDQLDNCDISYGAYAYADPLLGSQAPGVKATANSHFHATCGYYGGNTYAYAYARATAGTTTTTKSQEDPKYNATWIDSAAAASASGSLDCYSYAYGRAWSDTLGINYWTEDTNYDCPLPPVVASITGPYSVSLTSSVPCSNVTWTASATGGSPGYTFAWYINSVYQGSGSQLTQTYCSSSQNVTVEVRANDTGGRTDNEFFTTAITYSTTTGGGGGGGNCTSRGCTYEN